VVTSQIHWVYNYTSCLIETPPPTHSGGAEWFFKNHTSRKIFTRFHGLRSFVVLVVMCVSQSQFFHKPVRKDKKVSTFFFLFFFFFDNWRLNILEPLKHLEHMFETLWSLSLAIEEVKVYRACKEKCYSCLLAKSCIHHSSSPTVHVVLGASPPTSLCIISLFCVCVCACALACLFLIFSSCLTQISNHFKSLRMAAQSY